MKLPPFEFILAALATYRISLMWTKENGPGRIFRKARAAPKPSSALREWLSCIFCFSMTVSAGMVGLLLWIGYDHHPAEWFIIWCGLSAVTVLLNQKFTKGEL